jgi:hypothetical protein
MVIITCFISGVLFLDPHKKKLLILLIIIIIIIIIRCRRSAREIRCGVPQAPNLGPILFLLFINDLPKCLQITKTKLFANKDLENVNQWLSAKKLTLIK